MKWIKEIITISIYDLFLFFISIVGIFNIFLLGIKRFYPVISITLSIVVATLLIFILKKFKFNFSPISVDKKILIILFVAVLLRLPMSFYLMGGQDQGTYVNISKQYDLNHKLYSVDKFRQTLTEAQKEIYDRYGNYIMPSMEKWNRPGSEYSMVFYPLHPSFMSIFGSILGSDNRIYSVLFFSIISLINIYLIVFNITHNKKISLLALFLMVINPVHVFFSKFTVGEITALAFSTAGFSFLIKFMNTKMQSKKSIIFLIFSLITFFNFMFLRMTFVIYLPILGLLFLYFLILEQEKYYKFAYFIYLIVTSLLLCFSIFYYKTLLFPLYNLIFDRGIKNVIIKYIHTNPVLLITLFVFILFCLYFINKYKQKINTKFIQKYSNWTLALVCIYFFIFILKRSVLEFNILNNGQRLSLLRWDLLYKGFDGIKYIPFVSILNYISYFGFIILILFFFINLFYLKNLKYSFVFFISFLFLYITNYRVNFMRYDYYNSRYYLTEVIPIMIIVMSIGFYELYQKNKILKFISALSFLFTIIYFLIFTLFQFNKYEGPDPLFFKYLDNKISNDSLLIFINKNIYESKYQVNYNLYVAGPLKYYYGKKVVVIDDTETLQDPNLKDLISKFNNVYYLSNISLQNKIFVNEELLEQLYYHFNNSPGCNYHNYEFLKIDNIQQINAGNFLKCKLLPNAYYNRTREYFFGQYKSL
ncbi:hypothetical protein A2V49_03605 [candidate division WWE3 bacterium RBG_19FT_COMBO_34_6]|uniref:Glycosyltransferase RgtA/B/C/D-like domain-containing protein n=1 Tax=candidate division WWE3 bacterium RBG_19FT_COMBO_34_6 TaxID=1802612 RepID=A0A1F4UK86_UNCKA|nr:MAG: hypothetical protein A2V49_03605 [candidate division WWE3 bacterium RBG_19FT_COMBO_34_6]